MVAIAFRVVLGLFQVMSKVDQRLRLFFFGFVLFCFGLLHDNTKDKDLFVYNYIHS